ncbi:MAG TPA: ABC transporter ATP-binding protein [Anaerolineales bacterium]|nr:ABC transporter ATP-binding protein [Anaerolineales bacterium]
MIKTEGLTKKFGPITAVEDLTLEIPAGEVFGFLGPNGAGKTTTVRLLTSLIGPTSGTARVNGYAIGTDDTNIRRSVGVLTETPGMYDNLSAERNLQIYASLYEVKDPQGQVEKYLRMLGLWERRSDPAGTFSKGMKQKLAIARALLHEPHTVFLDEPTSALDPESAHLVRDFILEIKKEGRTIFLCTHNLDEADRLCDRIGVFKTHLLVVDTPTRLRAQVFGRKVVFHLQKADEALAAQVRALKYVKEARPIDNKILVTLDDPETHNPEIIRLLVGSGADVQFVGELRHSLEDVYLQLVKNT